jgi:hypothetical protein
MQASLACIHFTAKHLRVQANKTWESQIQPNMSRFAVFLHMEKAFETKYHPSLLYEF